MEQPSMQINFNTLNPNSLNEMFKTNSKGVLVNHIFVAEDNVTKSYEISTMPNSASNWHVKPGRWYYEIFGWLSRVWQWIRSPETARLKNLRQIVAHKYMEATPDSVSRIFLTESVMDHLNNAIQKHNQNRWCSKIELFRNYETGNHPLSYSLLSLFNEKIQEIQSLEDAKSVYADFQKVNDLMGRLHPESNSTKMSKSIEETYVKFLAEDQAQAQINELELIELPSFEEIVKKPIIPIPEPLEESSLTRLEESTRNKLTKLRAQKILLREVADELSELTDKSSKACSNLLNKTEKDFEDALEVAINDILNKLNPPQDPEIEATSDKASLDRVKAILNTTKIYIRKLRVRQEVTNPENLTKAKESPLTIRQFYEKAKDAQNTFNEYSTEDRIENLAKIAAAFYEIILNHHLEEQKKGFLNTGKYEKSAEEKDFEIFLGEHPEYKTAFGNLKTWLHAYSVAAERIKALQDDNTIQQAESIIRHLNTSIDKQQESNAIFVLKQILRDSPILRDSFSKMFNKQINDLITPLSEVKDIEFTSPLLSNAANLAKLYGSWSAHFGPIEESPQFKNGLIPLAILYVIGSIIKEKPRLSDEKSPEAIEESINLPIPLLYAIGVDINPPEDKTVFDYVATSADITTCVKLDNIIFNIERLNIELQLVSLFTNCRENWPCLEEWREKVREKTQEIYNAIYGRLVELYLTPDSISNFITEIKKNTITTLFSQIFTMCTYIDSHYHFFFINEKDNTVATESFRKLTNTILKSIHSLVPKIKKFKFDPDITELQNEFTAVSVKLKAYQEKINQRQPQEEKDEDFITIYEALGNFINALNRHVKTPRDQLQTYDKSVSPPLSPREGVLNTAPLTPKRKELLKKEESNQAL